MTNNILFLDPVHNDTLAVFQTVRRVRARRDDIDAIVELTYNEEGQLHSFDDQPAYRKIDRDSTQETERRWFQDGLEHRTGKHSGEGFFDDGRLAFRHWRVLGKLHREQGPCVEMFDQKSGIAIEHQYRQNGKFFRSDGPADIDISAKSGVVIYEAWFTEKSSQAEHRIDGPAITHRDSESGIATEQIWLKNGKLFRPAGLAPVVARDKITGLITKEQFEDGRYGNSIGFKPR